MATYTLDARKLLCPMPVIRTQEKIKKLAVDDILEVICTDPGTMHDIPTWCRMYGHELLLTTQENDEFHFQIKVVSVEPDNASAPQEW